MILPDSTIEVAARAIYGDGKCSCYDCELERANARTQASAALTAALPDLVEICAKVVEEAIPYGYEPYNSVRRKSAARIRSLLAIPEDGQ